MIGFVWDDGGRAESGRKGKAGDCVCRALAILTARPYRECYQALADANKADPRGKGAGRGKRTAQQGIMPKVRDKVFREFGLVKVKLPKGRRPTYTEAWEEYGDCIVTTTKHSCAIVDGALRDTFDGRTYTMDHIDQNKGDSLATFPVEHNRKAMSVWVRGE